MTWRLFAFAMAAVNTSVACVVVISCIVDGAMLEPRPEATDATSEALFMAFFCAANMVLAWRSFRKESGI